jgi:DNA recombination protein RmuC
VTEILLIVGLAVLVIVMGLVLALFRKARPTDATELASRLHGFEKSQERTERAVREEVAQSREELGKATREQREELTGAFTTFSAYVAQRMLEAANVEKAQLDAFSGQLTSFANASGERLDGVRAESAAGAKQLREEVVMTLRSMYEAQAKNLDGIRVETATGAKQLREEVIAALEAVRVTVEGKLQALQADNNKQLDLMRATVDEKLQGTLEKRLGESFRQVSERLELVHKGLGEMQTLATGVGDLKKVLTNVKTRGTWGEVQLGALLEQVLIPSQFATNVATKGEGERVEFAVKLPGQGPDKDDIVWLPIDAKFPVEDYQRLVEAQERADVDAVEAAGKRLENSVRLCAADICKKYLNPPKTTDFAILFLPIEGLFAEVIRRTGLTEVIQRECRVVIAGPTTLWSILSSLQMGFRTLAIEKRSSEVWNLLAGVKTEWTKYGEVLDAVQKKLHQASETIDKVKVRSRAVGRKLRDVQELPAGEAAILPIDEPDDDEEAAQGSADWGSDSSTGTSLLGGVGSPQASVDGLVDFGHFQR